MTLPSRTTTPWLDVSVLPMLISNVVVAASAKEQADGEISNSAIPANEGSNLMDNGISTG